MSRIGVFVCHCGLNIAKTVRVSELAEFAATLPDVVIARDYKFMCSTPGQEMIRQRYQAIPAGPGHCHGLLAADA